MSPKRSVVVTGMGAVTPFGVGVQVLASSLRAGKSGIRLLQQLDTTELPTKGGGEVLADMPEVAGVSPFVPRFVQFAAVAFQEAWKQAGLGERVIDESIAERHFAVDPYIVNPIANKSFADDPPVNIPLQAERLGVLLGTSRGVVRELELACSLLQKKGLAGLQAEGVDLLSTLFPTWGSSVLGHTIANLAGAHGPVQTLSAACASGTIAIGEAARLIADGRCDVVIAGGAEAPFTPTSFAGVCSSKAMSEHWDDPTVASRPFDRTRSGYVMGEGAGVLVLEAEEYARARGAHILAEIIGYAQTDDATHITVPTGEGLRVAIQLALEEAKVSPQELDYINAHGTSTQLNDKWETWAVRAALGAAAYRIPISSTKSMTGHLLGAAGAIEAISCLIALQEQFLPPTINYREQDPDCDLDYVPNEARPTQVHTVLTQSLGFGGHNAVLLLRGL